MRIISLISLTKLVYIVGLTIAISSFVIYVYLIIPEIISTSDYYSNLKNIIFKQEYKSEFEFIEIIKSWPSYKLFYELYPDATEIVEYYVAGVKIYIIATNQTNNNMLTLELAIDTSINDYQHRDEYFKYIICESTLPSSLYLSAEGDEILDFIKTIDCLNSDAYLTRGEVENTKIVSQSEPIYGNTPSGEPRTSSSTEMVRIDSVELSNTDFDVNTIFIKSDKLNPNIPTGQFTKWAEENVVRYPPPWILSEREQIVITSPHDIIIPQNTPNSTQFANGTIIDAPKQYQDYFDYFPSYVPEGMEMKGFTFSTFDNTTYLIMYYAPIPTIIDFDTINHYEFADAGGITVDLVHEHGKTTHSETWEHWQLVYPTSEADRDYVILHDEDNHVYVAYGSNFVALSMHEHMIISFDSYSHSGEELYKMAETIMDAEAP